MAVVTFSESGWDAIDCLDHKVQEKILNCLDDIETGAQKRSEILQSDTGYKYHYINFEFDRKVYIVIADLSRHYGSQEDEVEIVDAGKQSDFIIG